MHAKEPEFMDKDIHSKTPCNRVLSKPGLPRCIGFLAPVTMAFHASCRRSGTTDPRMYADVYYLAWKFIAILTLEGLLLDGLTTKRLTMRSYHWPLDRYPCRSLHDRNAIDGLENSRRSTTYLRTVIIGQP